MILDFFDNEIKNSINNLDLNKLYEIRLKKDLPITIFYDFKIYYLTKDYYSLSDKDSIICTKKMIDGIIYRVTEYSIYSTNDTIKEGYITTKDGVRIGISGECVCENSRVITIKNFSSLVIRIPHEIIGCSDKIYNKIFKNKVYNTLIISPPRFGKTTILKDLLRNFDKYTKKNILLIDERGELSVKNYNFVDVIKNSDKLYAFTFGIRSLSPEIIITDELSSKFDWELVSTASNSGVKIIASAHGESLEDITKKNYFIKNVFDRYVVLNSNGKMGESRIFDGDKNELDC